MRKKRIDLIKEVGKPYITYMLCAVVQKVADSIDDGREEINCCEHCPATNRCARGHNGFNDWLEEKGWFMEKD